MQRRVYRGIELAEFRFALRVDRLYIVPDHPKLFNNVKGQEFLFPRGPRR